MKGNHLEKHDYITVTAIDNFKARINMTVNRHGCKVTAKATVPDIQYKAVAGAFMAFDNACKKAKVNPGIEMTEVKVMVDNAADFTSLAHSIARAASVRRMASEVINGQ